MVVKACAGKKADGSPCRTWPLAGEAHCLWHWPDKSEEAADARRLGGLRRRRERTVAGAYDLAGLGSVEDIRRVLEIAMLDAVGLENSVARGRLLLGIVTAAARLLEVDQFRPFAIEDEAV